MRVKETCCGSEASYEILDVSPGVDEDFLDMFYEDWNIDILNKKWEEFKRRKKNGET